MPNRNRSNSKRSSQMDESARAATVTVCGIHAVRDLLQESRILQLYVAGASGAAARARDLAQAAAAQNIPVHPKSPQQLAALAQTPHHQGVVAAATLPQGNLQKATEGDAPLLALDGVTDPRNLGALVRVARAFGAAAVITPAARSAPLSAVAMRAAAGACAQIPVIRVPNMARALRQLDEAGRRIIGAAEDAQKTLSPPPPRVCWMLGDEGAGLRRLTRAHCHEMVRIPTVPGPAGCLNVVTAAAVCLSAGTMGEQG